MTKVSREEVISIARSSAIDLPSNEVDSIAVQLDEVLTYAARVNEVIGDAAAIPKNVNIYRGDEVKPSHCEVLRALAPEREGDYFVVPIILEGADHTTPMED
jgi:aspartyl/glutamyl-tRNA(Asn/Gln) amidotransferase C subunit